MVLWLILAACDNGKIGEGDPVVETDLDAPTYYADVKPLIAEHCTRCHYTDGLGAGDFTDLDEVTALAPAIYSAVADGRMPPPASDPGCQDYAGSDALNLSDEEKETILRWIDADTPLGDPADEPELPVVSNDLDDPDLVIMMDQPYQPTYSDAANPGNEYRCFLLEKPEDMQSFYITALAPVIDHAAIAHHAVLFTTKSKDLAPYLDDYTDGDGVDCINDMNAIDGMIGAWAPGMMPIQFPEGAGMRIAEDDQIILQMHYFYSGEETADQPDHSGYAFDVAESVDTTIFMAPLGNFNFRIPADDDDYTVTDSLYNSYVDLKTYGMFPHMHILGQRFEARIEHSDGSETCLVEGEYDFDNQMTYQFTEVIPFEQGDTIRYSCNWNNSESNPGLSTEPKTTSYGERTDEEMCFFFTFVSL